MNSTVRSMALSDIAALLEAQVVTGRQPTGLGIGRVCASDLMSDVLAFGKSRSLLLTGLVNPQTVRTAEMSDIPAICFVHGKKPSPEVVALAEATRITLLCTRLSLFEACGRLHTAGLAGCDA